MDVRERIEEILRELIPDINLLSDNLMEEDGVGSLMMIQIISELDIAFDIEITFDDIENQSFRTVDIIEEMVRRHMEE